MPEDTSSKDAALSLTEPQKQASREKWAIFAAVAGTFFAARSFGNDGDNLSVFDAWPSVEAVIFLIAGGVITLYLRHLTAATVLLTGAAAWIGQEMFLGRDADDYDLRFGAYAFLAGAVFAAVTAYKSRKLLQVSNMDESLLDTLPKKKVLDMVASVDVEQPNVSVENIEEGDILDQTVVNHKRQQAAAALPVAAAAATNTPEKPDVESATTPTQTAGRGSGGAGPAEKEAAYVALQQRRGQAKSTTSGWEKAGKVADGVGLVFGGIAWVLLKLVAVAFIVGGVWIMQLGFWPGIFVIAYGVYLILPGDKWLIG